MDVERRKHVDCKQERKEKVSVVRIVKVEGRREERVCARVVERARLEPV